MPQLIVDSPIGPIRIASAEGVISAVAIHAAPQHVETENDPLLAEAERQIRAYFASGLTRFDLPLEPATSTRGGALRDAIASIPHGSVARYGEVAAAAGSSARAVGQACARNPLPLIIPCHRVLASTGIGDYSAGAGVKTKQWLLAHEAGDLWAR